MKHLKSYEKIINKDFKKYLVWLVEKSTNDEYDYYYVFKYVQKTKDSAYLLVLFSYLPENDFKKKIVDVKSKFSYSYEQVDRCVIFQSDDLNECEEYVETLIQQQKFNL